jgi:hypothetical protein
MLKNIWINLCIKGGLMFFVSIMINSDNTFAEARSSAVIQENVSATANSGGNVIDGSGNIQTGDARAESKVETSVSGGDDTKVKVKTQAEANGKKVEIEKEISDPNQGLNVDISVGSDENQAQADAQAQMNVENKTDSVARTNTDKDQQDSGFFAQVKNSVERGIEKLFSTISSLFS